MLYGGQLGQERELWDSLRREDLVGAVYLVYMKSSIFWNITPYSPLIVSRRFGGNFPSIFNTED
jgi:hypothetical protein